MATRKLSILDDFGHFWCFLGSHTSMDAYKRSCNTLTQYQSSCLQLRPFRCCHSSIVPKNNIMNVVNMLFRYNINPKVVWLGTPLKTADIWYLGSCQTGPSFFDNFRSRYSPRVALQVGTFGLAGKILVVAMETPEVAKVSDFGCFLGFLGSLTSMEGYNRSCNTPKWPASQALSGSKEKKWKK